MNVNCRSSSSYLSAQTQSSLPNAEIARMASQSFSASVWVLPRFLLPRLGWRRRYPDQFVIGETFTQYSSCYPLKAVAIGSLPTIVPEGLFVKVAE